jgi:hypothetical protein
MAHGAFAAEFLVKADANWQDSLPQVAVNAMNTSDKASYGARYEKGDIVAIRADGWKWGKEECLPKFVVVKVPGLSVTDAEAQYDGSLTDQSNVQTPTLPAKSIPSKGGSLNVGIATQESVNSLPVDPVTLRNSKFSFPSSVIDSAVKGIATIQPASIGAVIKEKTGASSEVVLPNQSLSANIGYYVKPIISGLADLIEPKAWAATQLLKTVMPSGGDYTSLNACMVAQQQNLVTNGYYLDVKIDGTWSSADTTAVNITSYTTDSTHYINIYTTSTARHHGVYSESYYVLKASSAGASVYDDGGIGNITLKNIQVQNTYAGTSIYSNAIRVNGDNNFVIGGIFISNGTNSSSSALRSTALKNLTVENSIFISKGGADAAYVGGGYSGATEHFYNSNFISLGSNKGFNQFNSGSYQVDVQNCYASSTSGTAYSMGALTKTFLTSASSDTSGTAGLQNIAYSTANFTNVTSGSENFNLPTGSALIGAGTDLSSTFTNDITGATRSTPWDIGAFKYASAGTTSKFTNETFTF